MDQETRALNPELQDDFRLIKQFFEEMIGCVVGCGCWEPGWDGEEGVRSFARSGFGSSREEGSPSALDVLASLDRCFANLTDGEMPAATETLELNFRDADDFRRFFGEARRVLDLELRGPGASPG